MQKKLLSFFKYILILSVGVGMLWLAFRGVNLNKTIDDMLKANFFWLFLSILASLIAFFSRAIRWNMLIDPLGYRPSVSNTLAALMIGYLANLAVPRLGEVTRCGTLSRAEKIPFESLIGTVIIERIIDVFCLLICILIVAVSEFDRLGSLLVEHIINPIIQNIIVKIKSPIFITFLGLIVLLIVWYFFIKKKSSNQLLKKLSMILIKILTGISTIRKLKNPIGFCFHTILIWFMYFLMSYLCFSSLEATSNLNWHAGLFVLVAGGIGMSAPVQGGIGIYHILVSEGLMLYGVLKQPSLTFATLMHTSQTLVVIILGALAFIYLFIKRKNAAAQHN